MAPDWSSWWQAAEAFGPRLAGAVAILAAFWIASRMVRRALRLLAARSEPGRREVIGLLAQAARVALVLVGWVSALGTLGIDVTAMVAGLGLTGFALSFALKDVLANAVAGVLILFYQPFLCGDRIRAAGHEGEVTAIDLRYTRLETDQGTVLVPNSRLFTDSVHVLRRGGAS